MIHSAQNATFKYLNRVVHDTAFRKTSKVCLLEHPKAMGEQRTFIELLIYVEGAVTLSGLDKIEHIILSKALFSQLSSCANSTGVLALMKRPQSASFFPEKAKKVMVLEAVQDPKNIGAVIRSAYSFGIDALVLLPGSADPYSPKALRASAGRSFSLPIFEWSVSNLEATLEGWNIYFFTPHAKTSFVAPKQGKIALVFGSEGTGLGDVMKQIKGVPVSVPMAPGSDSLNIAVCAGIVGFMLH